MTINEKLAASSIVFGFLYILVLYAIISVPELSNEFKNRMRGSGAVLFLATFLTLMGAIWA